MTDGGFDQDRGYIFNYQATNINITSKKTTAFAIRLAPSVSNAIVGDLGARELINRAQLLLQGIEITAGGSTNVNSALVVEGVLNPSNYPTNPVNITWNSLSSAALPTGQPSFSQIAAGTSVLFNNVASYNYNTQLAMPQSAAVMSVNNIASLQTYDDVIAPTATNSIAGNTRISAVTTATTTFTGSTVTTGTGTTFNASISGTTMTLLNIPVSGPAAVTVGMVLTSAAVAGTYVTGIISGTGTTPGSTFSVSISQTLASSGLTGTLNAFATTAVSGSPLQYGQQLTGGSVTPGTYILYQVSGTTGGAGTYVVNQAFINTPTGATGFLISLNSPTVGALANNTGITITRNTYALPGETVFSFIAGQSGREALDLTPLKELTNTPIGGRGTFPNGPDVLFINVYLTQGAPINANLVLRWGEAQA